MFPRFIKNRPANVFRMGGEVRTNMQELENRSTEAAVFQLSETRKLSVITLNVGLYNEGVKFKSQGRISVKCSKTATNFSAKWSPSCPKSFFFVLVVSNLS